MPQYIADHGWLNVPGAVAAVGLARHAVGRLGDLDFVEPPAIGAQPAKGHTAAPAEPVKAAANVYCLRDRKGVEADEAIASDRSIANANAKGAGWIFKLKLARAADADVLRDEAADLALVG